MSARSVLFFVDMVFRSVLSVHALIVLDHTLCLSSAPREVDCCMALS